MYTCDHPAWEATPGTRIEMPALTSEVARLVDRNSEFTEIAREKINEFRDHAETYSDDEVLGLAHIAAAALVDQGKIFHGREEAIRYLALNASAVLEDLWAADDTLSRNSPVRHIQFDDMVAKRKADLLSAETNHPTFGESDFVCYSEEEIRRFAFDIRSLFLIDRAKHLAICTRCQARLESWTKLAEKFSKALPHTIGGLMRNLALEGALSFVMDNLGQFHDTVTAISLFGLLESMLLYLSQVLFTGRGTSRGIAAAMILSLLTIIAQLIHVFLKPNYISSGSGIVIVLFVSPC